MKEETSHGKIAETLSDREPPKVQSSSQNPDPRSEISEEVLFPLFEDISGVATHKFDAGGGFPSNANVPADASDIPAVRFRRLFRQVRSGKAPPRQAIKATCAECCGFEDVGERVRNCHSFQCPLWLYRPFQNQFSPDLE
jgi:hypothetical protein